MPVSQMANAHRCWACRWPTKTSSSPEIFRPPPAPKCWPITAVRLTPPWSAVWVQVALAWCPWASSIATNSPWVQATTTAPTSRCKTLGTSAACRVVPPAVLLLPWLLVWCPQPQAPTPAARSVSRLRCRASPASNRPMVAARVTAWWPSPPASTKPARWRAARSTARCCSRPWPALI